jgi:ribosomal subunit interface protein
MQFDIQARGFKLTRSIKTYVLRRLNDTLSRCDEAIHSVRIRLSDINGPKGGADKRCTIEVRLNQLPPVVVEDIQSDLYAAVDQATVRTERSVAKKLQRKRNYRRHIVPFNDAIPV